MEYLKPSGDMTGVADYENITAQLLEKRSCLFGQR